MPSRTTLDALRVPVAVLLLAVAGFVLLPRDGDGGTATGSRTPLPSVEVIEAGGEVLTTPSPTASPTTPPTPTQAPTPTPTPEPPDTFTARVLACRSISGDRCNRELDRLDRLDRFSALVRFGDARPGDVIEAVLAGPDGTIPGGPFALTGGGDGYYYTTFSVRGLPTGEYMLTAMRNGEEVASTRLVKRR